MYRLYIDETGNADLGASINPNHRYLSLTGVIMGLEYARANTYPALEQIKADFFGSHPDEPVILHRKEIKEKKWPFRALRDPDTEARFNAALLTYLGDLDCRVVTVVIDKLEHLNRYAVWRYHPYHYCLEVLVERYVNFLRDGGRKGDVMAEARGGKADMRLEKAFARLYDQGTDNVSRQLIKRLLTSKKLKIKAKAANVTGLQVADMFAHPSAMYVRSLHNAGEAPDRFGGNIVELLLDSKYRRSHWSGKIEGYGIKWLP
ncbi:MAG TPA: DUF3800 domain-containing protein [Stellaceae bacterium]|nr:DUF3800 domain-containing protein [Stellaceae bacterium]